MSERQFDGFTGECVCGLAICQCGQRSIAAWLRLRRLVLTTAADQSRVIDDLTAERDKYRDACFRLIGYYGVGESPDGIWPSDGDFARQVKAELEGEK